MVLFGRMLHDLDEEEETFQVVGMDVNGKRSVRTIALTDVRQFLHTDFHLGRFGSGDGDDDDDGLDCLPATQQLFSNNKKKQTNKVADKCSPKKPKWKEARKRSAVDSIGKRDGAKRSCSSSIAATPAAAEANSFPDVSKISLKDDDDDDSSNDTDSSSMDVDEEDADIVNVSSNEAFLLNEKLELTNRRVLVTLADCFKDPVNYNLLGAYESETEIVFVTFESDSGVARSAEIVLAPSRAANFLSNVQCDVRCFKCNKVFDCFFLFDNHYQHMHGAEYYARERLADNTRQKDVVIVYVALNYVVPVRGESAAAALS